MPVSSSESRSRTLAKALTWRAVATTITMSVAWVVTGQLEFAATIGVADALVKLGAYYLHERAWNRVGYGRPREPEYRI